MLTVAEVVVERIALLQCSNDMQPSFAVNGWFQTTVRFEQFGGSYEVPSDVFLWQRYFQVVPSPIGSGFYFEKEGRVWSFFNPAQYRKI